MSKVTDTLTDRQPKYGQFEKLAEFAQQIKDLIRDCPSHVQMSDAQIEALDMIAVKMARIMNGDPDLVDSWLDIQGYAQLAINDIERRKEQ